MSLLSSALFWGDRAGVLVARGGELDMSQPSNGWLRKVGVLDFLDFVISFFSLYLFRFLF